MNTSVGIRLSLSELQYLEALGKKHGQKKPDVIRQLIRMSQDRSKEGAKVRNLERQLGGMAEDIKYLSSLLTSMVKKISKSDPQEAEKMIAEAVQASKRKGHENQTQ